MNITRNQWLAIIVLVLSVSSGATAQLTDIFGPGMAKILGSLSSLGATIVSGVQLILGGQGQQVKDVAAMPGVEQVTINANANQALATVAVDPAQTKIEPKASDVQAVAETAKGT